MRERPKSFIKKLIKIKEELLEHLGATVFSSAVGVIFCTLLWVFMKGEIEHHLFHIFHVTHLLFSSAATSIMFFIHEKKFAKAFLVTFIGVVSACTISDIFMPYLIIKSFGIDIELHLCIIQHPYVLLPYIVVGFLCGWAATAGKKSQNTFLFSHIAHILLSSVASLLYIASFGFSQWIDYFSLIFLLVIFCVMIPCCLSDIIFPLLLTKSSC